MRVRAGVTPRQPVDIHSEKDVSTFRFYPPPPSEPRRDNETPLKLRAVTACAVTSL
uniref:Uncharacterized protein n=1 Tax=Enterobacter cloacae TaxID=550 RepID=A0A4P8GKC6_ENTCL|nr:hypothetical protein [Enterobacter cloacae]